MSKKARAAKAAAEKSTTATVAAPEVTTDATTAGAVETVAAPAAPEVTGTAPASDATDGSAPSVEINVTDAATGKVKKKRVPMARVFNADGNVMLLDGNVGSVKGYVTAFMALPVGARKGYDNYWAKEDGFTNPEAILKLTPQGIGKMLSILQHLAANIIGNGGDEGTEMSGILTAVRGYEEIAVAEAAAVAQNKLIEEALASLTKALGGDQNKARAMLAQHMPTATPAQIANAGAPASSVTATEPTLEESGGTVPDAEDNAPAEETVTV